MLHHYAVDFLAPLLVSPYLKNDLLIVDVVSDAPRNGELLVHTDVLSMDAFRPRAQRVDAVRLRGAGSSARALVMPVHVLLHEATCSENAIWGCVLRFRLTGADNATLAENFLFPRSPKDTPMPTATFQVGFHTGRGIPPFAATSSHCWSAWGPSPPCR